MKAEYNGITLEGMPKEMAEFAQELRNRTATTVTQIPIYIDGKEIERLIVDAMGRVYRLGVRI